MSVSMEASWYLEKGFTLGHAGYFAPRPPMGPPPRSALPDPVSTKTTKLHFTGHDNPRHHSDGFYRPGASAIAGSSGDRLPAGPQAPMRGSVAKAAADYNKPGDETEVEEIYFTKSPGEPLHGTQFLRVVPNDNFTRMGWEQPGVAFDGLIDREVRQWILPFTNIADFSANREQWHSRWMQAGICRSWQGSDHGSSVLRNMVFT